jgi:hypothetical protein
MMRKGSSARERAFVRRPRRVARRVAVALALSAALLLVAGTTSALAGPGVSLRASNGKGGFVSGPNADGKTIRGLLAQVGIPAQSVASVTVTGEEGNASAVSKAEIDLARVSDQGDSTLFVLRGRQIRAQGTRPLYMVVNVNSDLDIETTASPERVKVGQEVSLTASVKIRPPGARLFYTWNFADGTADVSGEDLTRVPHSFPSSGSFPVAVVVRCIGGSTCGGQGTVNVEVAGQERSRDELPGAPQGSDSGSGLGGTGSGGTGTGTGGGDGSGDEAGGSAGSSQSRKSPPPLRAERPEPRSPFSADPQSGAGTTVVQGVLLAGAGTPLEGPLSKGESGGSPKAAKGTPGTVGSPSRLGAGLALALAIVSMGALREQRRVKLRVA